MATITPTVEFIETERYSRQLIRVTWTALTETDEAAAVACGDFADRSVQFLGTFDSATVVFQGSNDGETFAALTDPQGNNISKTAAAIEAVTELTAFAKPVASGGGATQSLTVVMIGRRQE